MTLSPIANPSTTNIPSGWQKFWGRLVTGLIGLWIILVAFGAQLTGWGASLFGFNLQPSRLAVGVSLAQAALIGAPLLLLLWFWRTTRYRAIFQSWLWATGFLLLLAPTRWL